MNREAYISDLLIVSNIRVPLRRRMGRSRLLVGRLCTFLLALNLMQTVLEGAKLACPPSRCLALENVIDLFERFPSSLRVEEEDVDGHDGTEGSEDHICLPFYEILAADIKTRSFD